MTTFKLPTIPDRGEIGIASIVNPHHEGPVDRPVEKNLIKRLDDWSPAGEITHPAPISSNEGMNNPTFNQPKLRG